MKDSPQADSQLDEYPSLKQFYEKGPIIGEGAFGKVYLCFSIEDKSPTPANENTNQTNLLSENLTTQKMTIKQTKVWALKKMKIKSSQKLEDLREVNIMRALEHQNLMQMHGILSDIKPHKKSYYLVMDYGIELMQFAKHKQIFFSKQIRKEVIRQLVEALAEMHTKGYIHRDVKPSNIYLMDDGNVKLGDFSISKQIISHAPSSAEQAASMQPENGSASKMTPNMTTRNYRAPEVIYGSRNYDKSIDIWSLGCTVAEILLQQPIFPGCTDINQLETIFRVVGHPQSCWPSAKQLPYYLEFDDKDMPIGLKNLLPDSEPELTALIENMLRLDPNQRLTIQQIQKHQYFENIHNNAAEQLTKLAKYLRGKKLRKLIK